MFWVSNKIFSLTFVNGFELALTNPVFEEDEVRDVIKFTLSQRNDKDEPQLCCEGLISLMGFFKMSDIIRNLPGGFPLEEMKKVVERSVLSMDSLAKAEQNRLKL